jgi:hypothetical protein
MTPGARYCHRCGTPAGATPPASRRLETAVPWAVAAIALVAVLALAVGQRFGARPSGTTDLLEGSNAQGATPISAPDALPQGGMPRAPDISRLTPAERAERLYDRIMTEHEAGRDDAVRRFLPMALAAYEMLAPLSLDQRYDLGRIGVVGGDALLARAQSDTILRERPTHLLGLALGATAARMTNDEARARALEQKLLAAQRTERASPLPEYLLHQRDLDAALSAAKSQGAR